MQKLQSGFAGLVYLFSYLADQVNITGFAERLEAMERKIAQQDKTIQKLEDQLNKTSMCAILFFLTISFLLEGSNI